MMTFESLAKRHGLVIVFGASDDLMEFRGAIYDELGAYEGTTAYVDSRGLLPARESIDEHEDALRDYFARQPNAVPIEALWDPGDGYSWKFKTDIPHETFEITEDGEPYCRGIVFALADVASKFGPEVQDIQDVEG
ncbi:MAG TPA: hypothetical protein VJ654_17570 [Noviherbaspirillum sp.]|nr:hypothetical protein [Noviherbaspirillum sp.]